MSRAVEAYVGLGANIGDAAATLERALAWIDGLDGVALLARSRLYRSAAWGLTDQPDFVNAVARVGTTLAPRALLEALLTLEQRAGRDRQSAPRWGPRTLDLDLLLHGEALVESDGLRLPHPHLHQRAFVLVPLAEIAPDLVVPGHGPVARLAAGMATDDIEALG